jgi:acetylornithine deacetylase
MPKEVSSGLVAELDAAVDEDRLVSTLRELISLRTENPFDEEPAEDQGEESVARYLAERLGRAGVARELVELGPRRFNLVARMGVGPRGLMLAGHMDTVRTVGYPDAYAAEVRDGRVHGRGACDMKGALACYLEVAEVLRAVGAPLEGSLFIVGVADEEYKMVGAREIGRSGPRVGGVIVGEPTGLRVCPASKGRVSTFVVTRGRAAHSSVPEAGVNAITHMGRVLRALEGYAEGLLEGSNAHPLLGRPRVNPGVIAGGVQVNVVPDECRLEVDRRTLPGETRESVYGELEALLSEVARRVPSFDAHLTEPSWLVPASETPADHALVAALLDGAEEVLGGRSEPAGFVAGSDAAYYGSPAVICGPGSLEQAHTTDEFVAVGELVAATRIYLRAALEMLGGTGEGRTP